MKVFNYLFYTVNFFLIISFNLYAQNTEPYLIPRQIFVGDPSALIVPLPAAIENSEDIILTKDKFFTDENYFPADENIDFHKIILEKRTSGSRLIIEFTAFAPGELKLPVINIGGEYFSQLSITVNSTINSSADRYLSGTESVLAMPGTAFMLYGTIAVLVFLILIVIWFVVKGRSLLKKIIEKWKYKRLFTSMRNTESRLSRAISKGIDKRVILDKLNYETRNFLSVLTNISCRSMSANELKKITINNQVLEKNFSIGNFFRVCDDYRFSGNEIESQSIINLLSDLGDLIGITEKLNQEKTEVKLS